MWSKIAICRKILFHIFRSNDRGAIVKTYRLKGTDAGINVNVPNDTRTISQTWRSRKNNRQQVDC
jgi:hypothetical protein